MNTRIIFWGEGREDEAASCHRFLIRIGVACPAPVRSNDILTAGGVSGMLVMVDGQISAISLPELVDWALDKGLLVRRGHYDAIVREAGDLRACMREALTMRHKTVRDSMVTDGAPHAGVRWSDDFKRLAEVAGLHLPDVNIAYYLDG